MEIKFKKLSPLAKQPTFGTADSAGADLYAATDSNTILRVGDTKLVPTGIAVEIPKGYVGLIFARSGLATKRGIAPANKVGVIDADYRGEIMVSLYNQSRNGQVIAPGERIAQMVVVPYMAAEYVEVEELDETERGEGGFGSTGTV